MNPLKRTAIVLELAGRMKEKGSWCGETHLQKAVFFLQTLAGVNTGFDFVLYRHGPFSFELRDELTAMRADNLMDLVIQPQPYGPKLIPSKQAEDIKGKFPKSLAEFGPKVNWVAKVVGDKGVGELEKLATALFITREAQGATAEERAAKLTSIKPHIKADAAIEAVHDVDKLLEEPLAS